MNIFYKNYTIEHHQELDSTNRLAFKMADGNQIKDYHVIVADRQTSGKGRSSRIWQSIDGNLHFSLILRPKIPTNKIVQLSFVAITALRLAIQNIAANKPIRIENKWPNDLLINGKKVAGLLLESSINQNNVVFVIIGIGLNLTASPDNPMFPASNLKDFGIDLNKQQGLEIFLDQFEELYQNYLSYGFRNIKNLWLQAAYKLDEKISINDGEKQIDGIFKGIDDDGNLILEHNKETIKVSVADIYNSD